MTRPDVQWLELDGSLIRYDRESETFYATLIVRRSVFLDQERVAALARLMDHVAPALDGRAVELRHFPKKG